MLRQTAGFPEPRIKRAPFSVGSQIDPPRTYFNAGSSFAAFFFFTSGFGAADFFLVFFSSAIPKDYSYERLSDMNSYRIVGWRDWQSLSLARIVHPDIPFVVHRLTCDDCDSVGLFAGEEEALEEVGNHGC